MKRAAKFSLTIPSDAAKKANTYDTSFLSVALSLDFQSITSRDKSISPGTQKDARAFLYSPHNCECIEKVSFGRYG